MLICSRETQVEVIKLFRLFIFILETILKRRAINLNVSPTDILCQIESLANEIVETVKISREKAAVKKKEEDEAWQLLMNKSN